MEERRKIQDRRQREPKQGLPDYYTRCATDRRNNKISDAQPNNNVLQYNHKAITA
jgi:hypothetical protein